MKGKSTLVILAAGVGSRMPEVTSETSKCIIDLDGITPLEHTIASFALSVDKVVVIVGHYHDKVIESVKKSVKARNLDIEVEFIVNDKFNYHGCEYSLSLAHASLEDSSTVYITEGDLLLNPEYISNVLESHDPVAVLARNHNYIDKTRSVVITSSDYNTKGYGDKFVYDPNHVDVFSKIESSCKIVGESLQLWKFSGLGLIQLVDEMKNYHDLAVNSDSPVNHSGLYSINKVIKKTQIKAIYVEGSDWINLNTVNDVKKAKSTEWLARAN